MCELLCIDSPMFQVRQMRANSTDAPREAATSPRWSSPVLSSVKDPPCAPSCLSSVNEAKRVIPGQRRSSGLVG
jgi:hypothetical protein